MCANKMKTLFCLTFATFVCWIQAENVHMSKVFILPIGPGMFNWTLHGRRDQYSYRPTLLNSPDLPSWIHYIYSSRHQTGFLYGVPPQLSRSTGIELEIIGLNRENFETRRRVVSMNIEEKSDPARYEVQLKINNLNVEDLFDTHRLSHLLDVFRSKLWPGSREDLHVTMLASAVQLGARLPLRPTEGEGVVIHLGSGADFSPSLRELQEEVKPLWKISSCPRDFKRTSVERLFREQGFSLDWCSFRLLEADEQKPVDPTEPTRVTAPLSPRYDEAASRWRATPSRANIPERSYAYEFVVTIVLPMLVLLLLVMLVSLILCFHRDGVKWNKGSEVQMVQYTSVPRPNDTMRSLFTRRAPSHGASMERDNSSAVVGDTSRSVTGSPNSSLPHSTSPRQNVDNNCYMRPNPPPYAGIFNR